LLIGTALCWHLVIAITFTIISTITDAFGAGESWRSVVLYVPAALAVGGLVSWRSSVALWAVFIVSGLSMVYLISLMMFFAPGVLLIGVAALLATVRPASRTSHSLT
jgi:hypothetical protein